MRLSRRVFSHWEKLFGVDNPLPCDLLDTGLRYDASNLIQPQFPVLVMCAFVMGCDAEENRGGTSETSDATCFVIAGAGG